MIQKLENAYRNKRVFLTGHTGFKGSWLLKILSILGADIRGYSLAPEREDSLFNLLKGDSLCNSIIEDIRNKKRLREEIVDFQPDYIFHLAAQPLVRNSYEEPVKTFEVNTMGCCFLLDAVRDIKQSCSIVIITTDKVYKNNEWIYPYRETDQLGGYDPYSASKASAELLIDSYRNSFFHPSLYDKHHKVIAVARAGNVIGGGDWSKDRLIPDIVKALSKKKIIVIRNPQSIRPWQHVIEPLIGYLILGNKMIENPTMFSHAFNFGPGNNDILSVEDIVKLSIKIWGNGEYKIDKQESILHEARLLKLDISKAQEYLGWIPKYSSREALLKTINWYKEYLFNKINIINYTEKQIFNCLNE